MKLVADESVDLPIIVALRAAGHEVLAVIELAPGISDETVLALANDHRDLLLTVDKDFGELVYRLRRVHWGVVLIRLAGLDPHQKALLVERVFQHRGPELSGSFTVISPTLVRVRGHQSQ
jgi:predicted nuclease of predicted toxin-antitoxin system